MLINQKKVKQFALGKSESLRNGKFTRVSKEFLNEMDSLLRAKIIEYIQRLPSVGCTIK
jgi:hypothetical protein